MRRREKIGGGEVFSQNRFPDGSFSWDARLQQEHRQTWCSPRYRGGMTGVLWNRTAGCSNLLAAVFKTLFEILPSFGYPYDTKQEQTYQMLLDSVQQ